MQNKLKPWMTFLIFNGVLLTITHCYQRFCELLPSAFLIILASYYRKLLVIIYTLFVSNGDNIKIGLYDVIFYIYLV